jgi:hypothetical protein
MVNRRFRINAALFAVLPAFWLGACGGETATPVRDPASAMATPDQLQALLSAAQVAIGEGRINQAGAILSEAVRTDTKKPIATTPRRSTSGRDRPARCSKPA